jgi:hypothetical protein
MGKKPTAAPVKAPSALARNLYWAAPFAVFLIFRLFSSEPFYDLGGDQCTFLELARTFPKHQLFNHELYLIHPPLFGWIIGLFALALPLLAAGLVTVLLFACLNFFATRELGRFEGHSRAAIFAGLLYLAVSRPGVAYDYHVARVSILVCGNAVALLAFLRMLRDPSRKSLLLAIAANAFALFVSDQGLVLLPCEAVIFLLRGSRRDWGRAALLAAASLAVAAIWPAVRLYEFTHRADVPAGISGTIEFTRNFPLKALLQPNFLPFTDTHRSLFTQTSMSLANLDLRRLVALPVDLLPLPAGLTAILLIALIALALGSRTRRKNALLWLVLSILFLIPFGVGMNEWYSMAFVVPFALLVMEGVSAGLELAPLEGAVSMALTLAAAAAAVFWIAAPETPHGLLSPGGGTHFLFARTPVTRGQAVAQWLAKAPRDTGIMTHTDLAPELVYLTDKRVVALPFDPALLDRFIAEYKIEYLVTSSDHLQTTDRYTSAEVSRYLFEHPDRYELVYSAPEQSVAYYVFRRRQL